MSAKRLQSITRGQILVQNALRKVVSEYGESFGVIALFVGAWSLVANFDGRPNHYFPSPLFTLQQTLEYGGDVVTAFQTTLTSVILGFLLAVIIGVSLGSVMAEIEVVQRMLMPLYVFTYSIPHAIVAPLFLLWFGTGFVGLALFVSWGAFFPIFINTMTGLNQLDEEFYQLASILDASEWHVFKYMKFWTALPHIASGVKIASQVAIVSVIIAEFIASGQGLGYLIVISNQRAQLGLMFGTIILIMAFGVLFYTSISLVIEYITPNVDSDHA